MDQYLNLNGSAGVTHYEAGPDFIKVQFQDASIYTYDYVTPGAQHVERMKQLARTGRGLSTYINRYIRSAYARKEP